MFSLVPLSACQSVSQYFISFARHALLVQFLAGLLEQNVIVYMIHILEKQVPTYFYCYFEFFDFFSPGIALVPKLQIEKDSQKKDLDR